MPPKQDIRSAGVTNDDKSVGGASSAAAAPGTEPWNTATNIPIGNAQPPSTPTNTSRSWRLKNDQLSEDLVNISQQITSNADGPDVSIYSRIAGNVTQGIRVQIAVLKTATPTLNPGVHVDIQKKLDLISQVEDPPYYTLRIGELSRLLAESSLRVCLLFDGSKEKATSQRLADQLLLIREGPIEAACDATFLTAEALMQASRCRDQLQAASTAWAAIGNRLRSRRAHDQHILRKTEDAHRSLCEVIAESIRALSPSSPIAQIEAERDQDIAAGDNSYARIAAFTEAEARLMVLWARALGND